MSFQPIALVALGGALGAVARFLLGNLFSTRFASWPLGTFVINVSGCFAIGFFLTFMAQRFPASAHEGWRFFFPVGFVGAYTTFSTYEYETLRLVQQGAWGRALSYVLASTIVGYAAVWLAVWLARRLS